MGFNVSLLTRKNILQLKPYTSARDEYKGKEGIFLDANENSFGSVTDTLHNRYPDPLQWELKEKLAAIKNVSPHNIFLGNGSDEPIDLLYRCFCYPSADEVIITPPTYGMYEVSASVNDISIKKVSLTADFDLDAESVLRQVTPQTKLIFLCSPNNPTGNCLESTAIEKILFEFNGIVVIDEAYTDFAPDASFLPKLPRFPNLVILQTFSKAWGMANLRLGVAYASAEIIQILNKVKPPYNISGLTQQLALQALSNTEKKEKFVQVIRKERQSLIEMLGSCPAIIKIYPSDANFLLVKVVSAKKLYQHLVNQKIITRDRSNVWLCDECLRITVGTPSENTALVQAIREYLPDYK